jgi:hypothetical protein
VEDLIALIQSEVRDRTGYTLGCEIIEAVKKGKGMDFIILTGMSGAQVQVIKALEDVGFSVVDNLPRL